MSVATIQPVPAHRIMDNDRKRALAGGDADDSSAPPLKKQLTMSNGAGASGEAADVPKFGSTNSTWQVDLDVSTPSYMGLMKARILICRTDYTKRCHFEAVEGI